MFASFRTNVDFDGVFSLAMLVVIAVGAAVVWRQLNRTAEPLLAVRVVGSLLVGIGLFNVFDGLVDHYVFGIHDAVHGTGAFNPHWVGVSLLILGVGIFVSTR